MHYEKKIHELELMAGAYRYLGSLANKYSTKYKSFDGYVFSLDTCDYNISIPELDIQYLRYDDEHTNIVFRLKCIIKRVKDKFEYIVSRFDMHEDRDYNCPTEETMIEMFDKFLKSDYKAVQWVNQRKTLKAINSLEG
jgi:hypothetical protein